MRKKAKDIYIKNRTYYFWNDIINIETFESNNIKIDDHTKMFLFTILNMWPSKIWNAYKFIVYILCTLFSDTPVDTLNSTLIQK